MAARERLDILLHQRGLAPSRARARALIMAGEVLVDGVRVDKPGVRPASGAVLTLKVRPRFVSRGGEKLAAALEVFPLHVAGLPCADVGASTGGFTDCLLQQGAARVYAIDVGYGQLAWTLRNDERVIVMERQNARHIQGLPEPVSFVVIDASFISLRLLLPVIHAWLSEQAEIVALIKPQFEAGKKDVGKGGVVRDTTVHRRVLDEVLRFASTHGYLVRGLLRSPLQGPAGNVEFLCWMSANQTAPLPELPDIDALIADVL